MEYDAAVLLSCAGQKAGNVLESYDGNVERVAETYEAGCLTRCVAVEHAGEIFGLVGDYTHRLAVETGEAGDDVGGEELL